MDINSLLIGAFGGAFLLFMAILIGLVIYLLNKWSHNYFVVVSDVSAGSVTKLKHECKLSNHPKLGQVLVSSSLKRATGVDSIPFFGHATMYPLSNGGHLKWLVPLSHYNGSYAPEKYDPTVYEEIEKVITNAKGEVQKKTEKVAYLVAKPTKASMRAHVLTQALEIGQDYPKELSFWQRWGSVAIGMLFMFLGLAAFMLLLIFGQQSMEKQMQAPLLSDQVAQRTVELIRNLENQTTEQGVPSGTLPNPFEFNPDSNNG
jgi:hypothetical protein